LPDIEHVFLLNEAHLQVNLCELQESVAARGFVAETLCDLEVLFHAAYHQHLLAKLRALRQHKRFAGMVARWNRKLFGAFGSTLPEEGCLDFPEAFTVQKIAHAFHDAMAQLQIV